MLKQIFMIFALLSCLCVSAEAGWFNCSSKFPKSEGVYNITGSTLDSNRLGSLTVNNAHFDQPLEALKELETHLGRQYLNFIITNEHGQTVSLLLDPSIDSFEDHESFTSFIQIPAPDGDFAYATLSCKMN